MVEEVVTIEEESPSVVESIAEAKAPIDDRGLTLLGSSCCEEYIAEVSLR